MEEPFPGPTIPLAASTIGGLDHLSAVDISDLLLLALALRRAAAVALAPTSSRHEIRVDHAGTSFEISSLAPELGDAVAARLAILARLEVGGPHPQLGKLRARFEPPPGGSPPQPIDLLVSVRPTAHGLAAEVHRVATLDETEPTVEPGDDADDGARVGKYRILEELGRGGMGIVYRSEHVILQKPVALKVLHSGFASDPALATQFVLEARAACRARHPNIVDVTDFGRFPDGRAFIVMELIEHETLAQLLTRGPLEPVRALDIARQVAEALHAAAESGVVHRDLKPANIFVGPGDRVKLGDFGVARIVDAAGSTDRAVVGTSGYMAPEQTRGDLADTRADLFSLGCVLYEMLSGRPPFVIDNAAPTPARHYTSAVPVVEAPAGVEFPESVQQLLDRAMAHDPADRHQTAGELLVELERLIRQLAPVGWQRWQT